MADISKITLPNGVTYDIKDEAARAAAAASKMTIVVVTELPTASVDTAGKFYLVKSTDEQEQNKYMEYITVQNADNSYSWEKLGSTDVDLSGYSQTGHTHSVTSNVAVGNHTYVPAGTISGIAWTGAATTSTGSVTAEGTVSAPTITVAAKDTLGTAKNLYSMTSVGSYTESSYTPESYSVAGENLTITKSSYTKESVTLPGREQIIVSASSSAPTFEGTAVSVSVTGTAQGSITAQGIFDGTEATISHSVTNNAVTSGTNSK